MLKINLGQNLSDLVSAVPGHHDKSAIVPSVGLTVRIRVRADAAVERMFWNFTQSLKQVREQSTSLSSDVHSSTVKSRSHSFLVLDLFYFY